MSTSNISGSPQLPQQGGDKITASQALVSNLLKALNPVNEAKVEKLIDAAIKSNQLSAVFKEFNIPDKLLKKLDTHDNKEVAKFLIDKNKENQKTETVSNAIATPQSPATKASWKKGILRSNTADTTKVNTVAQKTVAPIAQKSGKDEFMDGLKQFLDAYSKRDIKAFDKAITTIFSSFEKPEKDWADDQIAKTDGAATAKWLDMDYFKDYLNVAANPRNKDQYGKEYTDTEKEVLKLFQKSAQAALDKLNI